jgi:hypothetical protein
MLPEIMVDLIAELFWESEEQTNVVLPLLSFELFDGYRMRFDTTFRKHSLHFLLCLRDC